MSSTRDRLTLVLCLSLMLGLPWLTRPADAADDWLAYESGWVCLSGQCRRPSEARNLRGRPNAEEPAMAHAFTLQREDGTVDYYAFTTAGACERLQTSFDGASDCRVFR